MKCGSCLYCKMYSPTKEDPYPNAACTKGHWEGIDSVAPEEGEDQWKDCKDYVKRYRRRFNVSKDVQEERA